MNAATHIPGKNAEASTDDDSELKQLERQVERGNFFVHTAIGESCTRLGEAQMFLHGLLELLLDKGIVSENELHTSVDQIRREMTERGELHGPGILIRVEKPLDERRPDSIVNCKERMHICHAVCCKLDFALSIPEVESGTVKWDLGRPYFIRHESSGHCAHINQVTGGCGIYEDRPSVCRGYSCANDERIWKNFEKMELNTEWIETNLTATTAPRLIGALMHDLGDLHVHRTQDIPEDELEGK